MILSNRHSRTAIADILNPVNGYRGHMELSGVTPKDHRKDNLKFIKQKQEEAKHRAEEEHKPKAEPFKLKKFQHVQSKIGSTLPLHEHAAAEVARPKTAASARSRSSAAGVPSHVAFGRTTNQSTIEQHNQQ